MLSSACAAGLAAVVCPLGWGTLPAQADPDDGPIPVLVARDVDGDGGYTPEVDEPQSGVTVTVTDAGGRSVSDTSDERGLVVVEPTDELSGGRYFVTADIPEDLGLTAVPAGENFAPMSSTVDVTSESQTVRLGVRARVEPDPTTPSVPQAQPQPRPQPVPAPVAPAAPRFAVGDRVWRDLDGDGKQGPDEPTAPRTSVQLLGSKGTVLDTTTTDRDGRYVFDDLPAGSYRLRVSDLGAHRQLTVRQAGAVPATSSAADPRTGTTDPFIVGQGAPDMIPASDFGDVRADFVKAAVNVGTVGSYSIANRVWRDSDADGVVGRDEPGVRGVAVELLDARDAVLAATTTDGDGRYVFDRLAAGRYRLKFPHLPRGLFFTAPGVGEDRTLDSDVYGNAVTAPITVSEEHPVESQVAVGLTTSPVAAASTSAAAPAAAGAEVAPGPGSGSVAQGAGTAAAVSLGAALLVAAAGLTVYLRRRVRRVRGPSS